MNTFLLSLAALFSIINPLATVPVFVALTEGKSPRKTRITAARTALNMMVILLISFFLGKYILSFFGVSLEALKIAGGLIIATSGFALLTGSFMKHKGLKKEVKDDVLTRDEVSLTPLAIPLLAGPGSICLLINYRQFYTSLQDLSLVVLSIIAVAVLTLLSLLISRIIVKALGASGINALSRIIGFIVISIGVEFVISTVMTIIKGL